MKKDKTYSLETVRKAWAAGLNQGKNKKSVEKLNETLASWAVKQVVAQSPLWDMDKKVWAALCIGLSAKDHKHPSEWAIRLNEIIHDVVADNIEPNETPRQCLARLKRED